MFAHWKLQRFGRSDPHNLEIYENLANPWSITPFWAIVTANLYDIFRQENRAKNREKAAESQKRRFQKAWFWVPAFIFECSKTKTGGFSAGLIFSTNVVYYQSRVKYPLFFEKLRWSDDKSITPHGPTRY